MSTKIHVLAADDQTPLAFVLTNGETHDSTAYPELAETLPEDHQVETAVADKAYDSGAIRDDLLNKDIEPAIPYRANTVDPAPIDRAAYRQRQKVERLINRLKQFRRIATRYDKLKVTFLSLIHLVACVILTS